MRHLTTFSLILAIAASTAAVAQAQTARSPRRAPAAQNRSLTPEEQASRQKEARILSQLRGIEAVLQSEQTLLERRLAYAAQLREKGLKDENSALLKQAEQIERQSFALYQKKVGQYANVQVQDVQGQNGQGQAGRNSASTGASSRSSGSNTWQPSRRATPRRSN